MFRKRLMLACLLLSTLLVITGCSGRPGGNWERMISDHFVYYYLAENGPPAKEDIDTLEQFYELAGRTWEFPADKQVNYYKFRDREQRKELTGYSGNGQAFLSRTEVQTIWPVDLHEVSHIYTLHYGRVTSAFWSEGIAMYYSWPSLEQRIGYWYGKTVHANSREWLLQGKLPDFSDMLYGWDKFRAIDDHITYPAAGSFVTYLIDHKGGIEQFKQLFRQLTDCRSNDEMLSTFADIYGSSFSEIQAEWKNALEAGNLQ